MLMMVLVAMVTVTPRPMVIFTYQCLRPLADSSCDPMRGLLMFVRHLLLLLCLLGQTYSTTGRHSICTLATRIAPREGPFRAFLAMKAKRVHWSPRKFLAR